MLIIGSTSLKHYFPDYTNVPKDIDYVVDDSSLHKNKPGIEYLENPIIIKYQQDGYLNPSLLLTLKLSHMFWPYKWEKHLYDIQFLFNKGVLYNLDILNELVEYWKEVKPKIRRSHLELSKDEFFNNAVNLDTQQHDNLHTLINPIPSYTKLLKDGCDVELCPKKWNNLSWIERFDVIYEETAVMAYERYKNTHYREAYRLQLKDNIIKHFPQYIALFAIKHYPELEKPKENYIEKIKSQL